MTRVAWHLVAGLALLSMMACGEVSVTPSGPGGPGPNGCIAGETQICTCNQGGEIVEGVQTCMANGQAWSACDCGGGGTTGQAPPGNAGCGDGICDQNETTENCPEDCGCPGECAPDETCRQVDGEWRCVPANPPGGQA